MIVVPKSVGRVGKVNSFSISSISLLSTPNLAEVGSSPGSVMNSVVEENSSVVRMVAKVVMAVEVIVEVVVVGSFVT